MESIDTLRGESARVFCEQVLKLDIADYDIDAISRVEVSGTSFLSEGPDYCEYRVIDCLGNEVGVWRELGY